MARRLHNDKYILIGQTAVPCPDLMEWARWMEDADRCVWRTRVGDWEVSTVFLGLDHCFIGDGPPILFETMVFCRPVDAEWERRKMSFTERIEWQKAHESLLNEKELELTYYQVRYVDWTEAEYGHELAVAMVEKVTGLSRQPQAQQDPLPLPDQ